MRRFRSLRSYLIIGNIFILGIIMISMGAIILVTSYNFQNIEIEEKSESILNGLSKEVAFYMTTPVEMMKQIRNQLNNSKTLDHFILETYLGTLAKVYPYIEEFRIIDRGGTVLNVVPERPSVVGSSVKYEDYFVNKPLGGEPKWSEVYTSTKDFKTYVTVTIDIGDYLVAADLNMTELSRKLNSSPSDSLISVSIVDQYGIYLVDSNMRKVEQKMKFPEFEALKIHEAQRDHLFELKAFPNVIFSAETIRGSDGWHLITAESKDEVLKPIETIVRNLIITLLVVIVASIAFILVIVKRLSVGLKDLEDSSKRISEGDYTQISKGSEFKELQVLIECFNDMMNNIMCREEEIRELNATLEKKVVERTEQLRTTNEMLEESNTQLEEMNAQLEEYNETLESRVQDRTKELEEASAYKSQFLANMSHEIRTPMNGILGMIHIIEQTPLNSEQVSFVETLKSSTQTLLTILNDILDFSKIEAGKVSIVEKPFHLIQTMTDLSRLFASAAHNKSLDLQLVIEPNLHPIWIGDEIRIKQIVSNLVGNAVKYTEEGYIRVSLSMTPLEDQRADVIITVQDTGIGIDASDYEKLFNRFSRFGENDGITAKGTGLGLAITKMLLELMHGSVEVTSEIGVGSTFVVRIPLMKGILMMTEPVQQSKVNKADPKSLKGLRLLLVEDDETSQYMMRLMLQKVGIQVLVAGNGQEAVDLLATEQVHLVLMDVNMPVLDGIKATAEIRRLGIRGIQREEVPIIAMTAYALSGDREKCIAAGMNDYISKPVNFKVLFEKINDYYDPDQEDGPQVAEVVTSLPESQGSVESVYDKLLSALQAASGLDESTCRFVIQTYIVQTTEILSDIERFAPTYEDDSIATLMHKLKGSSGNVRADDIRESATIAEHAHKERALDVFIREFERIKEMVETLKANV